LLGYRSDTSVSGADIAKKLIGTLEVAEFDRLSTLMMHFVLHVWPAAPDASTLFVLQGRGANHPTRVVLLRNTTNFKPPQSDRIVFSAQVDWGGRDNPLIVALPDRVDFDTASDAEMQAVADLLCAEFNADRCGVASVLNRLGEILIVKLLRALIESGAVGTGLLGGLADKRLSRAIVALHDAPGKNWTNSQMADVAGLSVSRFTELFRNAVGVTPAAYLRQWRMVLAKRDIERGDRIDAVARRYGYGSSEALNHMVRRLSGQTPMALRKKADA
jgi:AraC-like DNA-binding protein